MDGETTDIYIQGQSVSHGIAPVFGRNVVSSRREECRGLFRSHLMNNERAAPSRLQLMRVIPRLERGDAGVQCRSPFCNFLSAAWRWRDSCLCFNCLLKRICEAVSRSSSKSTFVVNFPEPQEEAVRFVYCRFFSKKKYHVSSTIGVAGRYTYPTPFISSPFPTTAPKSNFPTSPVRICLLHIALIIVPPFYLATTTITPITIKIKIKITHKKHQDSSDNNTHLFSFPSLPYLLPPHNRMGGLG